MDNGDQHARPLLNFGLHSLPLLREVETRSISAENPDGARGGGARAEPEPDAPGREMGRGWKARPCRNIPAGQTVTLAEIEGPGSIEHIWITGKTNILRSCVLRMYWEGQSRPSVEVPLGDFFANGHGILAEVNSLPVAANPEGGLNCYWPMPFAQSARVTIENQWHEDTGGVFYQITYALGEVPQQAGRFHAQWRRSVPAREYPEHVILDGVEGDGQYVGTYLAWTQLAEGWWGEGEVKFYIDGDEQYPTICGTGTEDYFGGAWCFGHGRTYSTPFLGYPLRAEGEGKVPRHGLYRWHVMDPVRFREDLRVTVQSLGMWQQDRKWKPRRDDIASTAFWYQDLPTPEFPPLPPVDQRRPR